MLYKQTELRLGDLSDIQYRICSCHCQSDATHTLLTVAFLGRYRDGSAGHGDVRFMTAVIQGALTAWRCEGLVIDLRELTYEWGDDATALLYGEFQRRPAALVTSDRNRGPLESLRATGLRPLVGTELAHPLCLSLEEALANVEHRAHEAAV